MLARPPLPIDEVISTIVDRLKEHGALVLKAEPGAGKTTRVPPAILDADLAKLASGKAGQIVVLQPRRVAARAAATRIAEERGTILGGEIGYRVRHESKSSKETRILVCTTGVFLRRLQDDPSIEDVAAVVFDEFHERSVDSDLALALTRQVQKEIRADLKIIVMSATLTSEPIAAYLDNCPTVDCPGRTHPIDLQYLPHTSSLSYNAASNIDNVASENIVKLLPDTRGDFLVFLPGVGEIRQTQLRLQESLGDADIVVMPLYGDMPLDEQQAVLKPATRRKIILATNVAETSLTVDGVTVVVDSGLARINRFNPDLGINSLDVTRISQASATQRAGRAGRTGPGRCLRLWSQNQHQQLEAFERPEIERVELSECALQLLAWGEKDLQNFPWFEAPPPQAIAKAMTLLEQLGATRQGKLTETGKEMAKLSLQPRLARLVLEGMRLGHTKRAVLCATVLSEKSPFKPPPPPPPPPGQYKGGNSSPKSYHSDSDILEKVRAIENFEQNKDRHSVAGELLPYAAKNILRAADQLLRQTKPMETASRPDQATTGIDEDEAILRAIMVAFPDRICKRRQPKEARAIMVGGRGVKLSEQSLLGDQQLFVAVDIFDQGKSEFTVKQASAVEEAWLPEALVTRAVEVGYDTAREKVIAFKRTRFCDIILDEKVTALPADVDPSEALAQAALANFDLSALVDEDSRDYLARIDCLRNALPELDLPDYGPIKGNDPWQRFLPFMCMGITSINELKQKSFVQAIQADLSHEQKNAIEREAPAHFDLPSGKRVKMQYQADGAPVLAARIQELFGRTETPRIARGRISLMLHLLAPNYRVQQITTDLAGFWQNTYPEIKKELKGRYPKHAWPDDPKTAQPGIRPQAKKPD